MALRVAARWPSATIDSSTVTRSAARTRRRGSRRSFPPGPFGDHVLHRGEQPARRVLAYTASAPVLTRGDAYSYVLGVKWALASVIIIQGARLPPRDRSSDRNEQHRSALEHHPANAACPHRAVRSGTCPHLLIAGSPPSPPKRETYVPAECVPPRVPLPRVVKGQQQLLMSSVAGYPQVRISAGQNLDRRPIFQAGHAGSIPVARSTGTRCSGTGFRDRAGLRRARPRIVRFYPALRRAARFLRTSSMSSARA